MLKRHLIVHGTVQGVGFRQFAVTEAKKAGINGWVRNRIEGTVEIKAEGNEEEMNAFIEAVKAGHRFASVTDVDISPADNVEHKGSFTVLY
ncbi:acylphosphatase [Salibacterium lacus]|uniref:Acylphosphatase n=1 Tax=Salibacterium lacus TaxID=1898109 RepID=A0ABW5SXB3_9BACI